MFDLEPVGRYRLDRPPLVQAIGQVRYPVLARLQTLDGIAGVQDRVAQLFPYMNEQQLQQVSLVLGPGAPATSQTRTDRAWQFTDDVGWTLVVAADNATLSVGAQYGSFEEFETRLRAIIDALHEEAHLPRCDRLALRYIDIAETPPGDEDAWRMWFRPELTGWTAGDLPGANTRVATSITQSQLLARPEGDLAGIPVDVQAVIRHGYLPRGTVVPGVNPPQTGTPAFLIDMDLFIDGHQPFDGEELTRQIGTLHEQVDRFFRWCLAPAGEEYFGLEEIVE